MIFPDLRDDGRTVDRTRYLFNETLDVFTVDTRAEWRLQHGVVSHTLLFGADYRDQDGHTDSGYHYHAAGPLDLYAPVYGQPQPDLGYDGGSDARLEQWGLYLQDQIRIGRWSLLLGLRQDLAEGGYANDSGSYVDSTDDDEFTGRAGLVYLFDNGLAPYLSYSESFQPASFSGFDYLGRPFKPITGRQVEAGAKYQPPSGNGFVTLSAFHLAQQNVLTPDLEHQTEDYFPQKQTGEIQVRGVELEGKAEIGNLSLVTALAWMTSEVTRSEDETRGKERSGVPRHQAALWADYRFAGVASGFNLGGGVRYSGSNWGDDLETVRNEPVSLIDLALGYELGRLIPAANGLRLALNVHNLADEKYVDCSSINYCTYGLLRTVQGSLSYAW